MSIEEVLMDRIVLNNHQVESLRYKELQILLEIDRICKKKNINYQLTYGTLLGAIRHQGFIPWDDDIDVAMERKEYKRFKLACKDELSSDFFYQSNDTDPEYYHLMDKIRMNNTVFKEKYIARWNIHHGVYVDIFPLDNVPTNAILRKLHFLHFQFFRIGLMSKYLDSNERNGVKKFLSHVVNLIYAPFSLDYLYRKSVEVASKYKDQGKYVFSLYDSISSDSLLEYAWIKDTEQVLFEGHLFPAPKHYDEVLHVLYGDYNTLPPESDRVPQHNIEELRL